MTKEFYQIGPNLKNQFDDDTTLKQLLEQYLPPEMYMALKPHLTQVGQDAKEQLLTWATEAETTEPVLTHFNPWGQRIDHIEMCSGWKNIEAYAAENGIVACGYERKQGEFSRIYQLALLYLFHPSSAFVSCPLAMTDGAAKLIETYGNNDLKKRAFFHLTTRDPKNFWTSGQWMTEKTGGSDVGLTQTRAEKSNTGFQLYGTKFFTSATTSPMAMTLARIDGAEAGSKGLSLFYLETKNAQGQLQNIRIQRLKDKLGTRAMPTAELVLEGTPAQLVGDIGYGVKKIATLFNITRIYNAICSVAQMRRALALAEDYSLKRFAFGKTLAEHFLFRETFASQKSEYDGCMHLIFHVAQLLGKIDVQKASADEQALLRVLTPLTKLFTGKVSVHVVSEMVEVFAGAGYCEDTGIPKLLRDAQVFPIWEGTTDVLSLDVLRALKKDCPLEVFIADISKRIEACPESAAKRELIDLVQELKRMASHLLEGEEEKTAHLRGLAMAMSRIYISSLLLRYSDKNIHRWLKLAKQTLQH